MDLFDQLHNDSLQIVEGIITEQHSQLIANADEVKGAVRKAFGSYIEWLRNREAVLLKSVDRAMEAHLARSQSCLGDALSSLRVLKDSVDLLDCDGTGRSVKDQIEKLVRDMTIAMERDMKVTPVVRFEEKGQSALKSVIGSCGEVFTESKNLFNPAAGKTITSSKWSNWLQSPTNQEHMEEPESWLPYDGDDMGVSMSFSKLVQSPSTPTLTAEQVVAATPVIFTGKVGKEIEFGTHFEHLMSTPLEQWLVSVVVKKRGERSCPGEVGNCVHVNGNLEIENLDQLKCPSSVAKDLETWLMQPDVVPMPPVAEICRAGHPCASLAQCASPSDRCIDYFYTLSRRSEDWLSPLENSKSDYSITFSTPSSSCGDEFEVLSWACSSSSSRTGRTAIVAAPATEHVRDELKMWLKATSPPLSNCEWLTDCCVESGCRSHVQSGIQEWLMKTA